MTDLYAVMGNPIGHSKSPLIHTEFARQTSQALRYEALLVPLDGFDQAVVDFRARGGRGLNITVPFKENAFRLCDRLTPRAERAGAVNTICLEDAQTLLGDNTDGAGLVNDLRRVFGSAGQGARILLVGAGGAARGALGVLLDESPAEVVVVNRTVSKAVALADLAASDLVRGVGFDELDGGGFDLVVNSTSAGLDGAAPPLSVSVFEAHTLCYDMMYASEPTPFLRLAESAGVVHLSDGLGMLVEQAAESFGVWRGIRPETSPVLEKLRSEFSTKV